MDLSSIPSDVLRLKREKWLKPESRRNPVADNSLKVLDGTKNQEKVDRIGSIGTPASNTSSFNNNKRIFYGVTPPARTPVSTSSDYIRNKADFYGATPLNTQNSYKKPGPQISESRPISQNTDYQINLQRFYSCTPSDPLLYKKNARIFHGYSEKSRSPLVSAGKTLAQ
jgi:hypothetical protein